MTFNFQLPDVDASPELDNADVGGDDEFRSSSSELLPEFVVEVKQELPPADEGPATNDAQEQMVINQNCAKIFVLYSKNVSHLNKFEVQC
jgi:hypothetical protein